MHETALLQDVTGIQLELNPAELTHLVTLCRSLDYRIERAGDVVTCDGPGVTLVAREVERSRGITALQFRLSRAFEHELIQLGKATLSFSGRTARLSLEP